MIAALMLAQPATASGFLQVGTGQRILDLPTASVLGGGGLRVGFDTGTAVPFFGTSITLGRIAANAGERVDLSAASWSATGGARFDLTDEAGPAQPFVSVGGMYGRTAGSYDYVDDDEVLALRFTGGPGVFAGGGADAFLSERVAIGLELGAALSFGEFGAEYREDGEVEDSVSYDMRALWTWADLHLTFRFGGGE